MVGQVWHSHDANMSGHRVLRKPDCSIDLIYGHTRQIKSGHTREMAETFDVFLVLLAAAPRFLGEAGNSDDATKLTIVAPRTIGLIWQMTERPLSRWNSSFQLLRFSILATLD